MADVIATTLYGEDYEKKITPGGGTTTQVPGEGRGALRTVLWIIGISAVGIVAFALLSTGGIKELSSKVKKFIGSEFANFLGGGVKRSDSDKEKSDKENKGEETDDKNEGD